jgi:hypothetical protein
MEEQMDPLLIAAYSSTAYGPASKTRKAEEAFYERHGGRVLRHAFPAASAAAVTVGLVILAGLIGQ